MAGAKRRGEPVSDWADLLDDVAALNAPKPIPNGWKTAMDIAAELQISYQHARHSLRKLVFAGKCESQIWRQRRSNGSHGNVVIYRQLKSGSV